MIDYRFVFLDGCSTGKGGLCEVFGIPRDEQMSSSEYQSKMGTAKRRAFVGWKHDISPGMIPGGALYIQLGNNPHEARAKFLTARARFIATWATFNRPPLQATLSDALFASGWILDTPEARAYLLRKDDNPQGPGLLAIRGYRDLRIDEDNQY